MSTFSQSVDFKTIETDLKNKVYFTLISIFGGVGAGEVALFFM